MKQFISLVFIVGVVFSLNAQKIIPLFDKIPNNTDTLNQETKLARGKWSAQITKPTLTIYLPTKDKSIGMGVIICPGGGYSFVSMASEGYEVAAKLNEMGIAAFVLKYRIPVDSRMVHKEICPLQDAQRAIQIVREHACEYNLDTAMVGIMGFSAGGHLASTASTHYQKYYIQNKEKTNLRPSFSILIYPVISFTDKIGHLGSRLKLIGEIPSIKLINEYSNELHVDKNTPPAFLVHAQNDNIVNPLNSLAYYESLLNNKVPNCEMHIFPTGGHGFGMKIQDSNVQWMNQLQDWLYTIKKSLATNKNN